ncbi:MAG TPA: 16S rRNA (guanine(966)-N(2))-methyltransferase RsmD, partial [Rhizobiaceae bacterium]|nr:16S rRNA (guanine(966)-N(2))-methyltransferase RsmD [Rhizobiaceae bacterium]
GEAALASAAEGGWLVPGALAIVEERVDAGLAAPAGFVLEDRRVFGDTAMHMLRFRS